MKKFSIVAILGVAAVFSTYKVVLSHCEVPCGIYDDKARITSLLENITTVEKAMQQIKALVGEETVNANQIVRWTVNKESHATAIQHIATQYFMTQRLKPKAESDAAAHKKYVTQLTLLHQMLVHAMKAKQTTDTAHTDALRSVVKEFEGVYFSH
jgi:nickel superoxide dismutase